MAVLLGSDKSRGQGGREKKKNKKKNKKEGKKKKTRDAKSININKCALSTLPNT